MNAKIMKRVMAVFSILTLLVLVSCSPKMNSDTMDNDMTPMQEKPMMKDMQGQEKTDSKGMMNEMENDTSTEKNTEEGMGGMDKMMK